MRDNSRRNTRAPYETFPQVTLGYDNLTTMRKIQETLSLWGV